jgi:hypothetical protein
VPGGAIIAALTYAVGVAGLNYVFVRSLYTGEMRGRFSGWIEARGSAPILYWIYIVGIGGAVLLVDVAVVLFVREALRRRR